MIAKSLSLRQHLAERDNLLHLGQAEVDKLNEKRQLDSLSDMSCSEFDSVLPTFSTPVRASFRKRMQRPRTAVAFHLVSTIKLNCFTHKTKMFFNFENDLNFVVVSGGCQDSEQARGEDEAERNESEKKMVKHRNRRTAATTRNTRCQP